jgi:hypothetical protein
VDGWQTESNDEAGIRIRQHTTIAERRAAAKSCAAELGLNIPTLIDAMDNSANNGFSAWPERIYIVTKFGKIHYRGGPGPFEFNPAEARVALIELLSTHPSNAG